MEFLTLAFSFSFDAFNCIQLYPKVHISLREHGERGINNLKLGAKMHWENK